nr:chaplin [Streptomyces sp. ODS25]
MRKGLITVAAATGVLAVTGGYAHADAGAHGAAVGSPGVLSGNLVQAPVDVPVNVCGNSVNVLGAGNAAAGNGCAGGSGQGGGSSAGGRTGGSPGVGSGNEVQVPVDVPVNVCGNSVNVLGAGNAAAGNGCAGGSGQGGGSSAGGRTGGSPGVGSGNEVQVPVDVPVNVCGNSVNVASLGNVAVGNSCVHTGGHDKPPTHPTPPPPGHPGTPGEPGEPQHPDEPADHHPQSPVESAEQLAETGSGLPLGTALTASGGALLAGAVLYRRARALR